jgi:hypothetical protein
MGCIEKESGSSHKSENEIVNEMKLKWDKNRQDTIVVNQQYYGHTDPVLVNQQQYHEKNTSEGNQRQSSHRPDTTFEKYSTPTRIQIKGTLTKDKKDTNRFERRSEVLINRGKHVKDICSLNVSNILEVYNTTLTIFNYIVGMVFL